MQSSSSMAGHGIAHAMIIPMTAAAFISAAVLSGCSLSSNAAFIGPSGSAVQEAKCSRSPTACYHEVSKVCHGGPYQILDSESHAGGWAADILPGPVTWYGMTYRCGPSDGKLADFQFRGQPYVSPAVDLVTVPTYAPAPLSTPSPMPLPAPSPAVAPPPLPAVTPTPPIPMVPMPNR